MVIKPTSLDVVILSLEVFSAGHHAHNQCTQWLIARHTVLIAGHCCWAHLDIPEPLFQFIDSLLSVTETKQSEIEGTSRVEALVGGVVHVLCVCVGCVWCVWCVGVEEYVKKCTAMGYMYVKIF